MLVCPHCRKPMVVLELDDVEIDYCLSCGGIWLDRGELDLLIGRDEGQSLASTFPEINSAGVEEKHKKCPICSDKMRKIEASCNSGTVVLDHCPKQHGIWFDGGELLHVVSCHASDRDKLIGFLNDMFKQKMEN